MKKTNGGWTLNKTLPWVFIIGGLVALVASLLLAIEVFNRLKNPAYVPVCNLNPILSCTSVADSAQSHVFGFPNYFIGIASYAAIVTVGVAMLARAKFKRWFWRVMELGLALSMIFITWLQFESLYEIGALCIFCMVVWTVTWPIFWYLTLYNLREGNIKSPNIIKWPIDFAQKHHGDVLVLWYLLIIGLILKRFWFYWSSLF